MPEPGELLPTPGQTVGPFYGYALPFPGGPDVVLAAHPRAVRLHGTVRDGAGDPVPDALLETWQADADGHVPAAPGSLSRGAGRGLALTGFGRVAVDAGGHYEITTVVPGAAPGRAPYVAITVFARGLLDRLLTRAYLPVDPDALAADAFLTGVPEDRRATLVAVPDELGFCFDITLQGEDETVFLAFPRGARR